VLPHHITAALATQHLYQDCIYKKTVPALTFRSPLSVCPSSTWQHYLYQIFRSVEAGFRSQETYCNWQTIWWPCLYLTDFHQLRTGTDSGESGFALSHNAILIICGSQFQVFQRFSSTSLVLKTVESCFVALNHYENGCNCA
jgi:hypothetical protein